MRVDQEDVMKGLVEEAYNVVIISSIA